MNTAFNKNQFIALYHAESDRLFRFCALRVSNREQAIDIAQDSFMKLWNAAVKSDKEIENPRALLFAIAHNLIIDWYRKKKSLSLDELTDPDGEGSCMQFSDESHLTIEVESEGKLLIQKIASLAPIYQQAVYLRFVEDMQPKEIAKVLGVSANVASVRIDRGIKDLQKLLHIEIHLDEPKNNTL